MWVHSTQNRGYIEDYSALDIIFNMEQKLIIKNKYVNCTSLKLHMKEGGRAKIIQKLTAANKMLTTLLGGWGPGIYIFYMGGPYTLIILGEGRYILYRNVLYRVVCPNFERPALTSNAQP